MHACASGKQREAEDSYIRGSTSASAWAPQAERRSTAAGIRSLVFSSTIRDARLNPTDSPSSLDNRLARPSVPARRSRASLERFGGVQVRDRDNKAGRSVGRRSRLTLGRLCALFNESGDLVSAPGLTSFMDMVERRRELERLGRLQPSGILVCLSCTCTRPRGASRSTKRLSRGKFNCVHNAARFLILISPPN